MTDILKNKNTSCCSIFKDQRILEKKKVGVINAEGPPVPIPNTEVKLCSGENTLRETVRENSPAPTSLARREERIFPSS